MDAGNGGKQEEDEQQPFQVVESSKRSWRMQCGGRVVVDAHQLAVHYRHHARFDLEMDFL